MSARDDIIPKGLRRDPRSKLWTDLEGDYGEPADRETEQLLEDFPLIRDAGVKANSGNADGKTNHASTPSWRDHVFTAAEL
jgi:hypothetical protein